MEVQVSALFLLRLACGARLGPLASGFEHPRPKFLLQDPPEEERDVFPFAASSRQNQTRGCGGLSAEYERRARP